MKVIVASFPKTGTKTMNSALSDLGYSVCDLIDHFWYHEKYWNKIFQHGGTVEDFREMYRDVDVVLDIPVFMFWEEISEAFPDAKIVFITRDEESWTESAYKQLTDVTKCPSLVAYIVSQVCPTSRRIANFFRQSISFAFSHDFSSTWTGMQPNKTLLRKRYKQHNTYFMQNAPMDKVLIFNLKDGWEPLCKFLEKDVPNTPFPWRNKKGSNEIMAIVDNHACGKQIQKEFLTISFGLIVVLGIVSYILFSF